MNEALVDQDTDSLTRSEPVHAVLLAELRLGRDRSTTLERAPGDGVAQDSGELLVDGDWPVVVDARHIQ